MKRAATEREERPPFFLSTIFFLQLQGKGGPSWWSSLLLISVETVWSVNKVTSPLSSLPVLEDKFLPVLEVREKGAEPQLMRTATAYIAPVTAALRPLLALVTLCHPSPATSPGYRLQHPTVDHSRPGARHRRERTVLSAWPEVAWRPNKPTNQNYWSSPSSNCVKGDINSKRVVPANLKNVAGIWNLWSELRFRMCLVGENFWVSVP